MWFYYSFGLAKWKHIWFIGVELESGWFTTVIADIK